MKKTQRHDKKIWLACYNPIANNWPPVMKKPYKEGKVCRYPDVQTEARQGQMIANAQEKLL